MNGKRITSPALLGALVVALTQTACTRNKGCDGPPLPAAQLAALKRTLRSTQSDPRAFLVVPNPLDATRDVQASSTSTNLLSAASGFNLPFLKSPDLLENDFVHVRIKEVTDDTSTLARPNDKGQFLFQVSDVHYSETMGYYSVIGEMDYVESLGFSVVKSRPLYIMVRATTTDNQPNAIYDHNYLNPKMPRTMRLFGDTEFAPGMDAEMYHHEFGHLFNESASHEVGIDYAGDNGAVYTEGSALHECLADYLAESYSDKPTIGRWIARNFPEYKAGQPLRTALNNNDGKDRFKDVAFADGSGQVPERYRTAEWCTRVMWEIRQAFVDNDSKYGSIYADRLVFSALGLLKKDTSIRQWHEALIQADSTLHCGGHQSDIEQAFSSRGFDRSPSTLSQPLKIQASAVSVDSGKSTTKSSTTIGFQMQIVNPNNDVARNVRVRLEPQDRGLFATVYQQAYGDLAPGQTLLVGVQGRGLPIDFSPQGETDQATRGARVKYILRVLVENGQDAIFEGALSL